MEEIYEIDKYSTLLKYGIFINTLLTLLGIVSSPTYNTTFIVMLALSFFTNMSLFFMGDVPEKLSNYGRYVYYFCIYLSLLVLPTYLFLKETNEGLWTAHLCISMIFSMILLPYEFYIYILVSGIVTAALLAGGGLHSNNLKILIYQVITLTIINRLFYVSRIKEIKRKEACVKNSMLNVSHELNTPLSSLLLKIENLRLGHLKNDAQNEEQLLKAEKNIKDIMLMIELLGKNLDENLCRLANQEICIRDVLYEALEEYPFSTTDKHKVKVIGTEREQITLGDKKIFKHIFFNLLKNSLYFVKKAGKGEINISLSEDAHYHIIRFYDSGYGIKAEYIDKIFDKFFSRRRYGTGMGLFFCKNAIEAFGGKIACTSKLNEYTEFTIKLVKIQKGEI